MHTGLISICIPTYNGEKYLRQCLQSCLDQSYTDFEVIICDDCSTDQTIGIITEFSAKFPQIKLFRNTTNLGLVGNWNNCIKNANGEWIKFVFQDDFISSDCLETFVKEINFDTKLLVSQRNYVFEFSPTPEQKKYYSEKSATFENICNHQTSEIKPATITSLAAQNIGINYIGEPSLALFKKSIIDELGLFDADFEQICDLEFFQRIACSYGLTYVALPICSFRVHQASTTNSNISRKNFTIRYLEPLVLLHKMLNNKNYSAFKNRLNNKEKARLHFYENTRLLEAQQTAKLNNDNKSSFDSYSERFPFLNSKVKNAACYKAILEIVKLKRKLIR